MRDRDQYDAARKAVLAKLQELAPKEFKLGKNRWGGDGITYTPDKEIEIDISGSTYTPDKVSVEYHLGYSELQHLGQRGKKFSTKLSYNYEFNAEAIVKRCRGRTALRKEAAEKEQAAGDREKQYQKGTGSTLEQFLAALPDELEPFVKETYRDAYRNFKFPNGLTVEVEATPDGMRVEEINLYASNVDAEHMVQFLKAMSKLPCIKGSDDEESLPDED